MSLRKFAISFTGVVSATAVAAVSTDCVSLFSLLPHEYKRILIANTDLKTIVVFFISYNFQQTYMIF